MLHSPINRVEEKKAGRAPNTQTSYPMSIFHITCTLPSVQYETSTDIFVLTAISGTILHEPFLPFAHSCSSFLYSLDVLASDFLRAPLQASIDPLSPSTPAYYRYITSCHRSYQLPHALYTVCPIPDLQVMKLPRSS